MFLPMMTNVNLAGVLAEAFQAKHLISPNVHVILVHFPLGIFVFGLFLEVFGFLWRRSGARDAARWMILFGGLLAVPAALSGIDALQDVDANASYKTEEGVHSLSPDQWGYMRKHVLFTSIGAGLAAIGATIGLGATGRWQRRLYLPLLLVLIAGAGLMGFGAHFGGEGIYLEKVAVQLRGAPATGFEFFAPARSTHVLLAGLAIAVALGAVGASLRAVSAARAAAEHAVTQMELDALVRPASPVPGPRRVTDDISVARTLNADAVLSPRVPSGRFWLLSALLFLLALGFGVWLLESGEMSRSFSELTARGVGNDIWEIARHPGLENRKAAHVAAGAALVVLPFILAGAVRWGTRHRFFITLLCALVVLLMAAEIWLGVLLIYRGTEGPIYRYSTVSESQAPINARPGQGNLVRIVLS